LANDPKISLEVFQIPTNMITMHQRFTQLHWVLGYGHK